MPDILAHLYHAGKKSKDPGFIYGSIFPDHFPFLKKKHETALSFAKKLSKKHKEYKKFYEGVKNHIQLDNKFHNKILPKKIKQLKKRFKVSDNFAHAILEIALDSNLHKEKGKELDKLLKIYKKNKRGAMIYYLSSFLKTSKKIIKKVVITLSDWVTLSNKFTIRALLKRAKISKQYFKTEFKKNNIFTKDMFKLFAIWKYAKELTKDYNKYL